MAMPNFNTAAASNSGADYDVFISHRGPDVKNTFASHLYRRLCHCGLTAFLDKEELQKGDTISSQIELAISSASVQIAILSPNFAESSWCLNELVLMKNSGATILPVFFKVDPSVVRYTEKHGVYFEAMLKLEGKTTSDPNKPRYASETIQKWRAALSYVADLSGFVHSDQDDEGELLDKVVERVLKEVPKTPLDVAKYPTGLDNKLEYFKKTVLYQQQQESERLETKVIGIVGIGGVGKTTLAKSFFNTQRSSFKESSFLSDVREAAARMSLNSLQSKLIKDLQHIDIPVDIHNGIELFQRHLKSCHVMIVLDDIDHISQLDAFLPLKNILSPGSLILVTSRDKHVLISSGVSEQSIYHLKGLDTPNSQELFCFHAFHKPLPPPEFADLVDRFVEACDGLPLSLKVFGAQVCGLNERSLWEEILDEIYDKLKISYDSLEPKVKEIFLDIACFFLGEDGDKAMRIWGKLGIQDLQYRCLVELDGKNKIQMHDHIRDMGRKIAEEGSIPLRLWQCTTNSIEDLLEQRTNLINEVHGIKLVFPYTDYFRYTQFWWYYSETRREMGSRSFSRGLEMRLRYLRLVAAEEGYLEDILRRVQSPHLIWLRWYGCNYSSLPDWIPMENLRVLEVEGSTLNTLWAHQSQTSTMQAVPLQLRELNIYAPLSEIPKSIGQLRYLEKIAICNDSASTLERLPDEFCKLLSLKYVVFSGLSRMVLLPDRFGELTNLQHIDLFGVASLQMLPNSFGNLQQLKHISLTGASSLQMLPDSFGELTNLQSINLDGAASLQMLPNSFGNLQQLKHISFEGASSLQMLPDSFGELTNLQRINLDGAASLQMLPNSFGNLQQLKDISLKGASSLQMLPDSFGELTNLQRINLDGAASLQMLPISFGNLSNLEFLELCSNLLEMLPPCLADLKSLKILLLSSLPQLKSLPDSIGQLTQLTELTIYRCGIEYLPRELLKMNNLKDLYVRDCPLREHPFRKVVEGDTETLLLEGERELNKLSSSSDRCLLTLKELNLSRTELREVSFDEAVCPNLQHLTLTQCSELRQIGGLSGLETLTSLQTLQVMKCEKLQSIQGLGTLTKLTELYIRECPEIRQLPGVEHLISLESLEVERCKKLHSIPGLGKLTKLTKLGITECPEIRELPGLGQLTKLTELHVYRSREMQELPGVEHLISLEKLNVRGCEKLQSIPGLGKLTRLTELDIRGCLEIRELQGVEYLISLENLHVGRCEKLQSIPGLGKLTRLTLLYISGCLEIRELQGVEYLISLENLYAGGCEKLQSIPGLGKLTKLTVLDISECPERRELPGLGQLTKLTELDISECPEIRELPGLGQLTKLTELNMSGCREIQELPSVEHLTSLERLYVGGCKKLEKIRGLGQLTQMRKLDVSECNELQELPGVEDLMSLEILNAGECPKLQWSEGVVEQLRQQLNDGFIYERRRKRCSCLQFLCMW